MFAAAKDSGSLPHETSATVAVDSGQYRLPHECASPSQAGDGIDFGDNRIVELNVYSHVFINNTKNCVEHCVNR